MSTFSYIYLVTAGLGAAAALVLLLRQRPGRPAPEKILFLILSILVFQSIVTFMYPRNPFDGPPLLWGLRISGDFMLWVLFYFYVGFMTNGKGATIFKKRHLLHLLLPILVLLPLVKQAAEIQQKPFFSKRWASWDGNRKFPAIPPPIPFNRRPWEMERGAALFQVDIFLSLHTGVPPLSGTLNRSFPDPPAGRFPGKMFPGNTSMRSTSILGIGILLFGWLYLVLMAFHIIKYSKKIRATSNGNGKQYLMWLTALITVIGSLQAVRTFLFFPSSALDWSFAFFSMTKYLPIPMFYIFTIGAYLIFSRKWPINEEKYGKNLLSPGELERYYRALIKYMKENKPYEDESLTLRQLARVLGMHANDLSQVINKKQGCNFNDFINSYRVEEVKKELLKPKNREKSILSIAFDSGFNSKSGFNLVFKKHTHMTPSEYVKKYRQLSPCRQ